MSLEHALSAVAATIALGAAMDADATVFIGLQQDAGPIVTVASDSSGFPFFGGSFGNFESVVVTGLGQPATVVPQLLQSGSFVSNDAGAEAGTLTVYVTSTGNAGPIGSLELQSGLASTGPTPGWSEALETYLDPGNGIYALAMLLGSGSFAALGSELDVAVANVSAPYSVTGVFRITAPSLGGSATSLTVTAEAVRAVAEPHGLALLGLGLAVLGGMAKRRRQ